MEQLGGHLVSSQGHPTAAFAGVSHSDQGRLSKTSSTSVFGAQWITFSPSKALPVAL